MRKFILNPAVVSAVFSGFGIVQQTRKGPRDWKLVLTWVTWVSSVAIAVGTVIEQAREHELDEY